MAKFKARARTIDMLGRQQIANISTAISELFKNAYDAYAEDAVVDYFQSDNLLIVRDDGTGMTLEDFENKWLVLGTESKLNSGKRAYRPDGKDLRPVMGEKGIGRLAIALLGQQVLILTRAEREGTYHDLVVCYIHWGVFALPGINLEQIEFPIRTFEDGVLPSEEDVCELVEEFEAGVEKLSNNLPDDSDEKPFYDEILEDIESFNVDPVDLDEFLEGISLKGNTSGTHFYIVNADPNIAAEIEYEQANGTKDFSKFLLGFSNSVFRENPPPPINTSFKYWKSDDAFEDLIADGEFFTQKELESADHHISGSVDEFGQFHGDVRVYNTSFEGHTISWQGGGGIPTNCGPFEIEFGYLSGHLSDSLLDAEDFHPLYRKLTQIGGMYVFRDRIRILPYGNSDVDWLGIEERRTKSASYYFFSHRRIFGAVKLSRNENGNLKEKAGREGFRQDKAYRQLREILENIFLQLAADFFRDSGDNFEQFAETREELNRLDKARRDQKKKVGDKKKNLAASLGSFFESVSEGLPQKQIDNLRETIVSKMNDATRLKDPDVASETMLSTEQLAYKKLESIRSSYKIAKPRGFSLSKELQRDWETYRIEFEVLNNKLLEPFEQEVTETIGRLAVEAKLYIDQRKRLESLIARQADESRKLVKREASEIKDIANETRSQALKLTKSAIKEMRDTVTDVEVEFAQTDLSNRSSEEIESLRDKLEGRIEVVGQKNTETLARVRDMLTSISSNLSQGVEITDFDVLEAMDQELNELREKADEDAELVQLGLAIAIINHEFESAIKGIRRSLKELRAWAREDEDLDDLYLDIRNNFDHLDGHLNLFTPLQRRLYRNTIELTGAEIYHYLKNLFASRLKRHKVKLSASQEFLDSKLDCYPSSIYPVFVNLVDNAVFWVKSISSDRLIALEVDDEGYIVRNNGPSIKQIDGEVIFHQGFSRKPNGRGLGLFISKKALQKEDMDIQLHEVTGDTGVTFKILWPESE